MTVLLDDFGLGDEGDPVVIALLPGFEAVHGETTGKTGHTTKDGLEGLGQMMGDEILVDLDPGDPRLPLVGDTGLAADAHDEVVVLHAVDEVLQGIRIDLGVGVNLMKELSSVDDLLRTDLIPTIRQTSKKSGVTPIRTCIFRNISKSNGVIRSL